MAATVCIDCEDGPCKKENGKLMCRDFNPTIELKCRKENNIWACLDCNKLCISVTDPVYIEYNIKDVKCNRNYKKYKEALECMVVISRVEDDEDDEYIYECSNCKLVVNEDDRYCRKCGSELFHDM